RALVPRSEKKPVKGTVPVAEIVDVAEQLDAACEAEARREPLDVSAQLAVTREHEQAARHLCGRADEVERSLDGRQPAGPADHEVVWCRAHRGTLGVARGCGAGDAPAEVEAVV